MYLNPAEDWQALTENYRSMSDGKLRELAAEFADLTSTAQQVLRDEMKLRKLGDPQSPAWGRAVRDEVESSTDEEDAEDGDESSDGDIPGVEYTWKTPLCDCDSGEQAWQICEMLRRARIESWIEGAQTYAHTSGSRHASFDTGGQRILVAADQLDEARMVIERPIPPDIIAESHRTEPEYELPVCPKCGAADPVLESVEPVNTWSCESCGAEWAEAAPEGDSEG